MNQSQYLPLAILGLMLFIFGIVDILFLQPAVGVILAVIGAVLAVFGWRRHKKPRA